LPDPIAQPTSGLLDFVAAVLEQEYGLAKSLCYGALAPTSDLQQAQQIFLNQVADLVSERLNPAFNCLLQGPDACYLAELLTEKRARCNPLVKNKSAGIGATEVVADLLAVVRQEEFDGIVLEGTIHYLDQLRYFQKARTLLNDRGLLVVAGEYVADDSLNEVSALANLSSCYQLSERLGFRLDQNKDYSADAKKSLDLLIEMAARHAAALGAKKALAADFNKQMNALRAMREEYESGRRSYRLLVFEKQLCTEGEYVNADYGDINSFRPAELAQLFEVSFSEPFDERLWHWKYAQNNGRCIVARNRRGGPIVSHYGGAPRRIDYFGREALALQVCDVMVQPEQRRYYGKSSLFFKTAATFLEREIGNTVTHLLGFGFPNQKAMNIATRLGLYNKTDDFVELCFGPELDQSDSGELVDFDFSNATHRQHLDSLWQQMRADFVDNIIGHRDSRYFDYRYNRHPHSERFRVCLLKGAVGDVLAVAVTKVHEGDLLLMDLVCPTINLSAAVSLLRRNLLDPKPEPKLRFWLTRGVIDLLPLQAAIVNDLGIEIPCNSWNPGPGAQQLMAAWWLTAGDMDFM